MTSVPVLNRATEMPVTLQIFLQHTVTQAITVHKQCNYPIISDYPGAISNYSKQTNTGHINIISNVRHLEVVSRNNEKNK